MSRPLRIEYPGAWYHVMNLGLNRNSIFKKTEDYVMFLDTLDESCRLFNVKVSAYCLQPNDYNLFLHTPDGNLSRFMRHLNGVYTQRFNRGRKREGPLFRGRYKSILIQEDVYALQVVKYIHLNPIANKLVKTLSKFRWSSHACYLSPDKSPKWVDVGFVLGKLADGRSHSASYYSNFMRLDLEDEVAAFYGKKRQSPVLGDETFIEKLQTLLSGQGGSSAEIPEQRKMLGKKIVRNINFVVTKRLKVPLKQLMVSQRGEENSARKMAILLSRELSGLTQSELAEEYGANSYRTIATACYRFKLALSQDKQFAKEYEWLKANVVKYIRNGSFPEGSGGKLD